MAWAAHWVTAGGTAGALALAAVYPLEFANIRLAAEVGSERQFGRGMTSAWAQAVRAEGLLAAYQVSGGGGGAGG